MIPQAGFLLIEKAQIRIECEYYETSYGFYCE